MPKKIEDSEINADDLHNKQAIEFPMTAGCDPKAYLTNLSHGIPQLDVSWLFSDEPW